MSIPDLEHVERCPAAPGPVVLRPVLETLQPAECRRLLAPGGVGRVAFAGCPAPQLLPVNYALVRGDIVIRAAPGTALADAVRWAVPPVGFEVDHLDDVLSQGWSVLVIGQAYRIVQRDELAHLHASLPVRPWPGGDRDVYVRITPERITGRRILAG